MNDVLGTAGKWNNLRKRKLADFVPPADLLVWLEGRKLTAVIHMGAISETTATDADAVIEHNFRLSLRLLDWCTQTKTPFIYASSAATYGNGEAGFVDDNAPAALARLTPLISMAGASIFLIWPSSSAQNKAKCYRRNGSA